MLQFSSLWILLKESFILLKIYLEENSGDLIHSKALAVFTLISF